MNDGELVRLLLGNYQRQYSLYKDLARLIQQKFVITPKERLLKQNFAIGKDL